VLPLQPGRTCCQGLYGNLDGSESKRGGPDDNDSIGSGGGKGFNFSQVSEMDVKWQTAMCWMIKETCLFDETVQFIRNYKHCSAASCCCCRSSRVFHAVDSATLQVTHRCTPAPYGILAVPAALPTHSFGVVDPCLDSDLRTLC